MILLNSRRGSVLTFRIMARETLLGRSDFRAPLVAPSENLGKTPRRKFLDSAPPLIFLLYKMIRVYLSRRWHKQGEIYVRPTSRQKLLLKWMSGDGPVH